MKTENIRDGGTKEKKTRASELNELFNYPFFTLVVKFSVEGGVLNRKTHNGFKLRLGNSIRFHQLFTSSFGRKTIAPLYRTRIYTHK